MRFLHAADLHLGKRLHMADLSEDQDDMLEQIVLAASQADAVLLAGDCYNRAQPAPEVINRFSRFLTELASLGKPVFVCRGNHDGEAQIAYASELLRVGGVYVTGMFAGGAQKIALSDAFGPINVYLLPYIKPAQARRRYPDKGVETYGDAVRAALEGLPLNPEERNVLVTHQFVMGAFESDSEEATVGGAERIDPSLFDAFDYVALGHLHRAQTLSGGRIRYSGAPLCYSFEEREQQKSVTMVELREKGEPPQIEEVAVRPKRRLVRREGTLMEICSLAPSMDYVQAVLTDKELPLDAAAALRATFPNLLNIRLGAKDGEAARAQMDIDRVESLSPLEHFVEFYASQNNGRPPNERQIAVVREILAERNVEI